VSERPHILLFVVDQLAASFLRAHGNAVTKTPAIDELAETGVVFENAYSPSPLCAPARAALMTGMLPTRTGVYDNSAEFASSIPAFTHYLRLEGYRTCLSGKMHFVGPDQLHGFEERLTTDVYPGDFGWTPDWRLGGERVDWWYHNMSSVVEAGVAEITNQLEYDDEVAFHAVRRLYDYARYERDAPLMLCVSFSHPHDPYVARQRFWDLYRDEDIDLPAAPGLPPEQMDAHSHRLWKSAAMDQVSITEDDVRAARHGYYASLSYVDERIGDVLAAFRACGLEDDAVVILTSDHGDFLGEHGLFYKMSFREHAAHVPFVVSAPVASLRVVCASRSRSSTSHRRCSTSHGRGSRKRSLRRSTGAASCRFSTAGASPSGRSRANFSRRPSLRRWSCSGAGAGSTSTRRATPISSSTWTTIRSSS